MTAPAGLALAVVLAGLAGRSALDKLLALRGGADLVSQWAQVASVVELVAGVSAAGIGFGLSVLVAQTPEPAIRRALYREALRTAALTCFPVMLLVGAWSAIAPQWLAGTGLPAWWLVAGAAAGWIAVLPAMLNAYWQGMQARGRMLVLAVASALAALAAASAAPAPSLVAALLAAQVLPVLLLFWERAPGAPLAPGLRSRLRRFLLPGVSIGVLSPLSMLAARNMVSHGLSWQDAGVLQALWRMQDWVGGIAAGVLAVFFLPRMAAAQGSTRWPAELRRAAGWTLAPAALALAALAVLHEPLLAAFYAREFKAEATGVWLLCAGTLLRIAAWIPLFGLYALHRTRSIAWTEPLSLPLFVGLLALQGGALSPARIGACWLAAYAVYAAVTSALLLAVRDPAVPDPAVPDPAVPDPAVHDGAVQNRAVRDRSSRPGAAHGSGVQTAGPAPR